MASLPPGTSMGQGRYTIVRELNRGGTAVVYAAIDAHSGLDVALKARVGGWRVKPWPHQLVALS